MKKNKSSKNNTPTLINQLLASHVSKVLNSLKNRSSYLLIDQNNSDLSRAEQENKSNFYFEEISEEHFKHILDDSDLSDGDCQVVHSNQEHEKICKKCNPNGYKQYRKLMNS